MLEPTQPPAVTAILARLVRATPLAWGQADCGGLVYRPLIVGPAILRQPTERGEAWRVALHPGRAVRPRAPGTRAELTARVQAMRAAGIACRVAAALVAPEDIAAHDALERGRCTRRGGRCRSEFYGWSLLYQIPGPPHVGLIDPHETHRDLPAFFESPLELLDRSEFLAQRGVRSRPIALFTQSEDFDVDPDGRLVNRYFPHGTLRHPNRLDWLD